MAALYITSSQARSGRTTIAAGLGRELAGRGKKVGYIKLAGAEPDTDGAFMKSVLGLSEPPEKIALVWDPAKPEQLKEAFAGAAAGKDIILVEGDKLEGSRQIADALDAGVIIVESYGKLSIDKYPELGKRLVGVVVNKVPASRLARARGELAAKLAQAGTVLLGALPEERSLLAPTVGDLTVRLGGQVLDGERSAPELIESVMLGAMTVDPGPDYYRRMENKAVVVRSERPDMQLAALETSTRCLVLTGETPPENMVLRKAKAKKVPIILTRDDIPGAVAKIESAIVQARFNQEKKLPYLGQVMKENFDFARLYKALGLG